MILNVPLADPVVRTSYSELTTHRKCPQQWFFHYAESLMADESVDAAVERDMGSWWQALLGSDALERGRKFDSLRAVPRTIKSVDGGPTWPGEDATAEAVLLEADVWWFHQTGAVRDVWTERLGEPMPDRLLAMYRDWTEEWAEERDYERPLAVELRWQRNLPQRAEDRRTPVAMVGYIDEVYLDRKRNLVTVRDNKAHRALKPTTAVSDMMDSQLQLYAWGASPLVREWNLGPVRATAYDRARMVAPKSPVVTQSGTLSKSVTDYDVGTYRRWSRGPEGMGVPYPGRKADGSGAGMYTVEQTVIDKLSTPAARSAWFQRTRVPLNVNVIRSHLRAAIDSSDDLRRSAARAERTREAARNLGRACDWCEYAKLCRAQMVGGPDGDYELIDFGLRRRPPRDVSSRT